MSAVSVLKAGHVPIPTYGPSRTQEPSSEPADLELAGPSLNGTALRLVHHNLNAQNQLWVFRPGDGAIYVLDFVPLRY